MEAELARARSPSLGTISCDSPDCVETVLVGPDCSHEQGRIKLMAAGWQSLGDYDYCHKCSVQGWAAIEGAIKTEARLAVEKAIAPLRWQIYGIKIAMGKLAGDTHVSSKTLESIEKALEGAEEALEELDANPS